MERKMSIVGLVGIEEVQPRSVIIQHIATDSLARYKGIGRLMIKEIIAYTNAIYIEAETDNVAVHFYRKCGFTIFSLGEKYPGVIRYKCVLKLQYT
ncbi:N-acetyltransferase [Mechercharimyces sp. CAU 1602]|uniref:GNAT family N-acetyltransferase n=1 Tax=Mechercharimyces sp. CAU 1602 TaxID=2973933 RepID=UPI002162504B|nr:GNAT family N-acetyltransferase [Mechercharimyces sp. CAU 1602]MCS1351090.1 GNAT family N-acetyltransferase [Mechercharimyces sp. CAU 1602]